MSTTNPVDILLEHDRWATRQILAACEMLSPAQFSQKFDLGPGSLQATLTHMIAAMNTWADTLSVRPLGRRIDQDGQSYSVQQLTALHDTAITAFIHIARTLPLDQVVTRERLGKTYTFPRVTIITHVATHDMHHRAQCLNMLKQLGVNPLPPSSVVEWSRATNAA